MFVLIAAILFGISLWISLTEAYQERDWPHHTFKYVLIFGAILLMSIGVFGH